MLQAEYWRARLEPESTWVEYGNDVEGSGFCKAGRNARDPLGKTAWNLQARARRRPLRTCRCFI